MKLQLVALCVVLVVSPLANDAAAQEWRGQVTPYVWASGAGGDLRPFSGGPSVSFDKSFPEVLDDSDGAFFLSGYLRNGRFALIGDLSHSASSTSGTIGPGYPAEGKLRQTSMTLAGGYRLIDRADMHVEALAGVRLWKVRASASIGGGALRASPEKSFADPIVGLRFNLALADRWSAIFYFDAGGFGAGSHRTSQVVATANYQVNDRLFVSAGYRQLDVDYRDDGTDVDVTMKGPLFGLTWKF